MRRHARLSSLNSWRWLASREIVRLGAHCTRPHSLLKAPRFQTVLLLCRCVLECCLRAGIVARGATHVPLACRVAQVSDDFAFVSYLQPFAGPTALFRHQPPKPLRHTVFDAIKACIEPSAQVLPLLLALLRRTADSRWLTSRKILYFAIAHARTAFLKHQDCKLSCYCVDVCWSGVSAPELWRAVRPKCLWLVGLLK
jgi:hypothetical protein